MAGEQYRRSVGVPPGPSVGVGNAAPPTSWTRTSRSPTSAFVALALDGKTAAADEFVIALEMTLTGQKVVPGFVQTAMENERVCDAFTPGAGITTGAG